MHSESEGVFGGQTEETPQPSRDVDHDSVASPAVDETLEPREEPLPVDEMTDKAKTIDDEPELVAEFADPGAEDGAGATLEVDEPWEGYDALTADEVIGRIGEADAAALAVLALYEQAHKKRRTVLTAAQRRQRELANAPS